MPRSPASASAHDHDHDDDDPLDASSPALLQPPDDPRRDYLALLDKPRLIDLLLALDTDRSLVVFPADLAHVVHRMREAAAAGVGATSASALFTSEPLLPNPLRAPKVQLEQSEMPSYEEMIAQAIAELGDPEGTAPKVLFQWMDQHYPLQNNFRPSASQALQRAYKRGRLDKLPSGRYILNPNWDGAPTSKRATRRPKQVKTEPTSVPVTMPMPMSFRPPAAAGTPGMFIAPPPGQPLVLPPYAFVLPTPAPAPVPTRTTPRRASKTKASYVYEDDGMDVEDLPPDEPSHAHAPAPIPVPTLYMPVVKAEPVEPSMEPDAELAESVHGLFAALARQLTDLQAERKKGRPK